MVLFCCECNLLCTLQGSEDLFLTVYYGCIYHLFPTLFIYGVMLGLKKNTIVQVTQKGCKSYI